MPLHFFKNNYPNEVVLKDITNNFQFQLHSNLFYHFY